ncbi:MAG: hypothetical protein J7494_14265 [Sphingobium sp.]|nr:hypothetical protein [Sphingobium sp.]
MSAIILVAAIWVVPASIRSMKASRKGRLGGAMSGIAGALDPVRALIVEEMEKRQKQDGEEADGDDEPLPG